jgi:hypothetical protein
MVGKQRWLSLLKGILLQKKIQARSSRLPVPTFAPALHPANARIERARLRMSTLSN